MRGNLQTRFKKLEEGQAEAMLLAYAGVKRMGLEQFIVERLPISLFVPPAGQASIALEIADTLNAEMKSALKAICNHSETEICISNERTFLKAMDGGCSIPVFAHGYFEEKNLIFHAGISSLDGKTVLEERATLSEVEYKNPLTATALAQKILSIGGAAILTEIRNQQSK
jgi:hydroxymethylbilane synthase